jgi:beta-fructofuranosidase
MGYKPNGMEMWDAWGIEHEGNMHLFHLQFLSPNSERTQQEADCLGHAVSRDLIHWEESALALTPGGSGEYDDMQPWTGSIWKEEDIFYLYYTMRSTQDMARGQRIGVAFSRDLKTWERYEGNPVIEPDPRWYVSHEQPLENGVVDCRDLVVVKHPKDDGWLGFYAARVHGEELGEGAVIALVRSDDLLHWEHLPPAFAPESYACVEVPEVFELNGRWYMTCLTSHGYGNRGIYRDNAIVSGTIYAVSDTPEGPYRELEEDHLLFGGDASSGYSFRSFCFGGKRYGMYTERESNTLSPPFEVRTTPEGYLRLGYSDLTASWRSKLLLDATQVQAVQVLPLPHGNWGLPGGRWNREDGGYVGEARRGWQIAGLCPSAANVEATASIVLETGVAAGLALLGDWEAADCAGTLVVMLDASEGRVRAGIAPLFNEPWMREWPIQHGRNYRLRVTVRTPRVEVYVDDWLVLQFALKENSSGQPDGKECGVGLFVDRARTFISGVEAFSLAVGALEQ